MFGFTVNQAALEAYLEGFYRKAAYWDYLVGGAFPGFYDIYQEAGIRPATATWMRSRVRRSSIRSRPRWNQNVDVIQLITWNDLR